MHWRRERVFVATQCLEKFGSVSNICFKTAVAGGEEWGVFLEVRALHPGITTAPSAGRWGWGTATFQPQELEN